MKRRPPKTLRWKAHRRFPPKQLQIHESNLTAFSKATSQAMAYGSSYVGLNFAVCNSGFRSSRTDLSRVKPELVMLRSVLKQRRVFVSAIDIASASLLRACVLRILFGPAD